MTELKHGSNVAMLQTTASFDVATDEWIINTPDEGALPAPSAQHTHHPGSTLSATVVTSPPLYPDTDNTTA